MEALYKKVTAKPFVDAWAECLRGRPKNSRIATLPELAMARAAAPAPHEPGKPWKTYYDGTSPLWENWFMTSSCVLLGMHEGAPTVCIVHGLSVTEAIGKTDQHFTFSQALWTELLTARTPAERMSVENVALRDSLRQHNDSAFTAKEMRDRSIFTALFSESFTAYTEAHRALAAEYLMCKIVYNRNLDRVPPAYEWLLTDPPIIDLDLEWVRQTQPPLTGAIGRYLVLENIMNVSLVSLGPLGTTRRCDLGTAGPRDDAKFLLVETT